MAIKQFVYNFVLPKLNKYVFGKFSLKLVTARTPNRNFTNFFEHLKKLDFVSNTVIDIGVGNGTTTLYDGNKSAKFYLIEPVPDDHGTVKRIAEKLNAEFFNVAAGASDGEVEFFLHNDVTGSSIFRQLEEEPSLDGRQIKVPMKRLDDMIPADVGRPCLLKIDTQGAELEVLKGAEKTLQNVDMVIIEVSLHQFREGCPEMDEVIHEMSLRGFACYEALEGHYRSLDNALAQLDIVFVRRDSVLRKHKTFFSLDQAKNYAEYGTLR